MNNLEINSVEILPIKPQQGLIAFVSFILNNQVYIGDVALYTKPSGEGYRLVYPTRKLANGKVVSCVHPITKEAGDIITNEVVKKYKQLVEKM